MADGAVLVGGRHRGGGFHIRAARVVTAAHVIGAATPGEVSFVSGDEPGNAVVEIEVDRELDLALLHLATPEGDDQTVAGRVNAGDEWTVLTRPDVNAPVLDGVVTIPARRIDNVSRLELDVIQMHVQQVLDSYHGYSGSAVRLRGDPSVVLGVLVEQVMSRQARTDQRAANVLYAVPIGVVLSRFGLDGVPAADEAALTPLGDYWFHVQELQAASLEGRDGERAAMAEFCRGPLRAMRWVAPPKAGKTALLADFVLRPPSGIVVAAFFVSRALIRHNDSDGYLDHVVPQLERIAAVPPNPQPRATGYFWRVLAAAAASAERQDRVLVLVIDGLDEDAGLGAPSGRPPIPALLNKIPTGSRLSPPAVNTPVCRPTSDRTTLCTRRRCRRWHPRPPP